MNSALFEEKAQLLGKEIAKLRQIDGTNCKLPLPIWSAAVELCRGRTISSVADQLKVTGQPGI